MALMTIMGGDSNDFVSDDVNAPDPYGGWDQPAGEADRSMDIGAMITAATAAIAPDYQGYMGNYGGAESASQSIIAGGAASSLGSNWISETFDKALKWYDGQKDSTKGAITTLAGSFIKGLFSYNDEQRKIKALEKSSDATMLNAQTNASATERKFDNASAIGKTNFGAQPQGLIFRNKLAPRQTRAGYTGG